MATRAEAEGALFDAIITGAEAAAEHKDASVLNEVAHAFAHVVHGAQGGNLEMKRENQEKYAGQTSYDYHETHHPDGADRPPVGFRKESNDGRADPPTRPD